MAVLKYVGFGSDNVSLVFTAPKVRKTPMGLGTNQKVLSCRGGTAAKRRTRTLAERRRHATGSTPWPLSDLGHWTCCRRARGAGQRVIADRLVHGVAAVAFASDARVEVVPMVAGCAAIVAAYEEAPSRGVPIMAAASAAPRGAEGALASLHAVDTVFAVMSLVLRRTGIRGLGPAAAAPMAWR